MISRPFSLLELRVQHFLFFPVKMAFKKNLKEAHNRPEQKLTLAVSRLVRMPCAQGSRPASTDGIFWLGQAVHL